MAIKRQPFPGAERFLPETRTLPVMQEAVQGCRGCDLYRFATQAVFGRGRVRAPLMLVGEQPGNDEDLKGEPFVGPAGRVLHEALAAAGIPRSATYVTNMVKHFRHEREGKRRLHKRPGAGHVTACRPWLEAELTAVRPRVVVLMGAVAAQGMLGSAFRVTQQRGKVFAAPFAEKVVVTAHPSAVLRQPSSRERAAARAALIADLRVAAKAADVRSAGKKVPPSAIRKRRSPASVGTR